MSEPTAWDRFAESLERGVTSRADLESLDLVALRQLNDLEREKARQLLAPRIDDGDPRIIDALAELDTPKAWAEVERAFMQSWGSAQVHAALWLWLKKRDLRVVPKLRAMVAANPNAPSLLIEIVTELQRIDSDEADQLMVDILAGSKDGRLTSAATDRIFVRHRFDQWELEGGAIFKLRCGLTSTFPSVRAAAIGELRRLIQRQNAGESDAQLGIVAQKLTRSPALDQVFRVAVDDSAPVPGNATLDQLQGGEHDWAIDLLLGRLEQGDAKVIPALQHLGGPRVQLALADHQAGRHIG